MPGTCHMRDARLAQRLFMLVAINSNTNAYAHRIQIACGCYDLLTTNVRTCDRNIGDVLTLLVAKWDMPHETSLIVKTPQGIRFQLSELRKAGVVSSTNRRLSK